MIANTLIFLLGMLVTALAALVLAPLFWRKAQSLARREFEATVPISANEIRAEFDRVRAEAAVAVRRQEVLSAEIREKAAKAEADRGRVVVEATELQIRNRRLTQTIEEQDATLEALRAALAGAEEENRNLVAELSDMRMAADEAARDFDALNERHRGLADLSDRQAVEIAEAEARIERLQSRLEPSSEDADDAEAERLAVEVASLREMLRQERAAFSLREERISSSASRQMTDDRGATDREPPSKTEPAPPRPGADVRREPSAKEAPSSGSPRFEAALGRRELPALDPAAEADIRERISDVAARVIRMTALAEGPNSPLAVLLDPSESGGGPLPGAKPTLAERVRLLAEAERKTGS